MSERNISTVKNSIICFVLLTFALSSLIYFLVMTSGRTSFLTILLMWIPGISAIITALIFFRSIKGFGWRPGNIKYLALGFFLPIAINIITYGLFWLFGLGSYTGNWPNLLRFGVIIGIIVSILLGLGEEIGWRGFLVPQLAKVTSFKWVVVISGVVWASWHFPLIIMGSYVSETPLWWSLPIFFFGVLLLSLVLAWITLKSGSLWPAVLYHGIDNYILQIFTPLASGIASAYYIGESGILTLIVMLAFAVIFWKYRDRLPDLRISKSDEPINNT